MDPLQQLKERLADLTDQMEGLQAKADAERRSLTDGEQAEFDGLVAEFEDTEADLKRRETIAAMKQRSEAPAARAAAPNAMASGETVPNNAAPRQRGDDGLRNTSLPTQRERGRWGFQNFGDFAASVRAASVGRGYDVRLNNASASTYGTEGVGADGGFAVPPEWRSEIMKLANSEGSLFSRVDVQPVSGNSITYPIDETTAWQTSGGILASWGGEAAAMTQSKPALKYLNTRLEKLTVLVPVTDELLEDSAAMNSYIPAKAGEKIDFKLTDAIVNGDGAGMPLGLLNAPCKITVTKESSQAADTIVAQNILKMYSRMPAANRNRAFWLINQDIEPQLLNLNITFKDAVGSAGIAAGAAAYMPPGGLSGSPYATLMGRPILPTEACGTLGDEGDIIFVDLGSYLMITKSGGVRQDISTHLWFDQGLTAFRFTMRANGQPWLSAPIARKNGSNTLSHIVTLQAR